MSEFSKGFGDVDTDRGETILYQFHNAMYSLYAEYDISFDELKAKYNPAVIEGLGLAANSSNMTNGATNRAMIALAEAGHGKIPVNYSGFFNALSGEATKVNLWQAFKEVASDSASDITEGLKNTGEAILETGGAVVNVAKYSKYFIYGGLALLIWGIYRNREDAADYAYGGAKKLGSATTGGLLSLGSSVLKKSKQKIEDL